MGETDRHVSSIYELAGFSEAEPVGVGTLARTLIGQRALRASTGTGGLRRRSGYGGWVIDVPTHLSSPAACFLIAIGLARWWCFEHVVKDWPDAADLGSSILLPTPALRLCVQVGDDAEAIASAMNAPLEIVELRMRMVFGPAASGEWARLTG